MKLLTFTALLIMSVMVVSCGGDKEKSSSTRGFSTSKLSTQSGYLNTQNWNIEVGGQSYPPNQAYAQLVNMALQEAQRKNIQPKQHNGVLKFKIKVTAQLMNYDQGYNQMNNNMYQQGGYNQGYNTGATQGTLNISNIVVY